MIDRKQTRNILKAIEPAKVIVVSGARRVGKTVLLRSLIREMNCPFLLLNGEDMETHELLDRRTVANYRNMLGNTRFLLIDEAQKIPDIGGKLKLMVDEISDLMVVITGSSAFDIAQKAGEPLTGRKKTFLLFPFADSELAPDEPLTTRKDNLFQRLVYGNYPELLNIHNPGDKAAYLKEIINSYLLKDILTFDTIRNSDKILQLLRLVAFQMGSEVSLNELSRNLQLSRPTVEKYLDLLSKVFVLYKAEGFSRNLRKEITKNSKWYFFDNGIRNAVLSNFAPLQSRTDVGALWENYCMSERLKYREYNGSHASTYFWRTYDQQEIDLIEDSDGALSAFEIKWQPRKAKTPPAFRNAYPDATYRVITPENYYAWVTGQDVS